MQTVRLLHIQHILRASAANLAIEVEIKLPEIATLSSISRNHQIRTKHKSNSHQVLQKALPLTRPQNYVQHSNQRVGIYQTKYS